MEQLGLFEEPELVQPSYVVLDTETTHLRPQYGHVIEVAARRDDGQTYQSLIFPPTPIKLETTALTGITQDMLNVAPDNRKVFPEFFEFIQGRVVVAHNAPFDMDWLKEEASRLGMSFEHDFIDTASIARMLLPDIPHLAGRSRYTLENLCTYFNITNESAHRAFADVDATYVLFADHLWQLCVDNKVNPVNLHVKPNRRKKAS